MDSQTKTVTPEDSQTKTKYSGYIPKVPKELYSIYLDSQVVLWEPRWALSRYDYNYEATWTPWNLARFQHLGVCRRTGPDLFSDTISNSHRVFGFVSQPRGCIVLVDHIVV